ncbi:MAG: transcription antitermination factor NusB [Armatimonadota bacterium]
MTRTAKSVRRAARELALNLLFQADVARLTLDEAIAAARENAKVPIEALETGIEYASGAWEAARDSDALVNRLAPEWTVERQSSVDRNVLRLAIYELRSRPEAPAAIIINEAVDLAKTYGSEESGKFVNGVLSAATRMIRDGEEENT